MSDINPYDFFAGLHDYLRPTEAEIYQQQREAERQKCGYSMHLGKPGTFRANELIPYGQIIIFDSDALEEAWKKYTYSYEFGELKGGAIYG